MSNTNFAIENGRPFAAVAVVEGIETRDGDFNRLLEQGSVSVDQIPFPLLYSHDSDQVIGRVDRFYSLAEASPEMTDRAVLESPDILQFDPMAVFIAEGFLACTEQALEIQDLLEMRMLRGVSVGAGNNSVAEDRDDAVVFNQFVVIELSVTSTQAIGPAMAWMADVEFMPVPERENALAKFTGVVNDFPVRPDAHHFEVPDVIPSSPEIDDRGKYVAFLGQFDVPHRGVSGREVYIPKDDDFSEFHTGSVRLADGTRLKTGVICKGMEHSDISLSGEQVRKRYEDSGMAAVDVVFHNTAEGVVAVGAVRPTVSAEDVRELEAAPLSGEWRVCADWKQRVFAALAVNTPGFKTEASVSESKTFSTDTVKVNALQGLFHYDDVLAQFVEPEVVEKVEEEGPLSDEDVRKLALLKLATAVKHNKD